MTYADSDANIDRLIRGLEAVCASHAQADPRPPLEIPDTPELRMETVMLPRDAFLGATEMVPWRQAAGRVSAEMILPVPAGDPDHRPRGNGARPRSSSTSSSSRPPVSSSRAPATRRSNNFRVAIEYG